MSQAEIITVLEESNIPLSLTEIAAKLCTSKVKISMSINKLLKYSEINYVELDRKVAMRFFKTKRRMKLYYL